MLGSRIRAFTLAALFVAAGCTVQGLVLPIGPQGGMAIELSGDGGNVEFQNALIGDRTVFTIEFWINAHYPPVTAAPEPDRNLIYGESYDGGGANDGACRDEVFLSSVEALNPKSELGAVALDQDPPTSSAIDVYSAPIPEGVWTHVAFVRDGDVARVYINGLLSAQGAAETYTGPAPTHFYLGLHKDPIYGDEYGDFTIDELRVSSTARYSSNFTPQTTYTADADTLSLWHFDEITGTATADAAGHEPNALLSDFTLRVLADR